MAGQVGFNIEKGTACCLTIQTVAPNDKGEGGSFQWELV